MAALAMAPDAGLRIVLATARSPRGVRGDVQATSRGHGCQNAWRASRALCRRRRCGQ
ncbi:hypothetical protein [Mesorhizobium sp. M2E.F.Ca.ET.209.01.1.1]|uniref:hypothetical protein n=1 Tax=Mesorhizobium sp. M2E.F.Ca.ET.209.01.1.1 TaxID=2500526 RepID=UPI001FEEE3FA|nr:hypothetical protein [Mesorhizobium sp. M2E.F.Ca.ET.209.01.1.1]